MHRPLVVSALAVWATLAATCLLAPAADWQPAGGRIKTRWAEDVSPDKVWPEYPRPQMVREDWLNLNGLWDYAIAAEGRPRSPQECEGKILVPFAGRVGPVGRDEARGPDEPAVVSPHVRGAGGVEGPARAAALRRGGLGATVWVNGKEVGAHQGGYDPFTFDITDALEAGRPAGTRRRRLGSDRRRHAAARQAGAQARRHLVHGRHRHLADGLARAGAGGGDRVGS